MKEGRKREVIWLVIRFYCLSNLWHPAVFSHSSVEHIGVLLLLLFCLDDFHCIGVLLLLLFCLDHFHCQLCLLTMFIMHRLVKEAAQDSWSLHLDLSLNFCVWQRWVVLGQSGRTRNKLMSKQNALAMLFEKDSLVMLISAPGQAVGRGCWRSMEMPVTESLTRAKLYCGISLDFRAYFTLNLRVAT